MDSWFVSTSQLIWIMLLSVFVYTFLWEDTLLFSMDLLSLYQPDISPFKELPDCFPKWLHHFYIATSRKWMLVPVSLLPRQPLWPSVLLMMAILVEVIRYLIVLLICIFLMAVLFSHFPGAVGPLYIFLGEMAVESLRPLFKLGHLC